MMIRRKATHNSNLSPMGGRIFQRVTQLRLTLLLLTLCFLSSGIGGVGTFGSEDGDDAGFAVGGYLPDYRLRAYLFPQIQDTQPPKQAAMTDLVLFSLQPHARGFFSCCLEEDHFELAEAFVNRTTTPFSLTPPLRVWVTLGGGGRTGAFPELCANDRLRQRLIGSVLALSAKHSFLGGIDLDFFQPRTIEERDNYLLFLSEAIQQWHHHGLKVSLTLHPRQGRMIPPSLYEVLDRIHFMAYDMGGGIGGSNGDIYHASFSKVKHVLEELLEPGGGLDTDAQRRKVLLGIPAYARHLRNPSQVKTVGELYDAIDDDKQFAMAHSLRGYEWESPPRVRAKIDLAKKLKLGGVFFWELGQDKPTSDHPAGILLETAAAAAAAETPGERLRNTEL